MLFRSGMPCAQDDLALPDFVLGFYDVVGAFDHLTREAWLFSSGLPLEGDERATHAARRLDRIARALERPARPLAPATRPAAAPAHARSPFTPAAYRQAVGVVQDRIRRGDIFQANLSQRWSLAHAHGEPIALAAALHAALARHSPAPHAAFFGAQDHAIASARSEERRVGKECRL